MRIKKIIYILIIVVFMFLIFMFSSKNSSSSNKTSKKFINYLIVIYENTFNKHVDRVELVNKLNYPIRKIAHYSLYFILGCVVFKFICTIGLKYKSIISLCICFIYACFDEIHQLYVPGRTGQFKDVLIDTIGALTSILLIKLIYYIFNKCRRKKKLV